jgi:hypothetical protein
MSDDFESRCVVKCRTCREMHPILISVNRTYNERVYGMIEMAMIKDNQNIAIK